VAPRVFRMPKFNASKDLTYDQTGVRPDCALAANFSSLELRKQAQ